MRADDAFVGPASSPEESSSPLGEKRTAANSTTDADSPFYVPRILDMLGGLVDRHRSFWLWLARLETKSLAQKLRQVPLIMPVYVCGLARSGSTLLHEVICSHPGVATHRIKDFPMTFTPYWWRRATTKVRPKEPHERPHRDKMMITTESPDSVEEMLWMAFFPQCHNPDVSNVIGGQESHPVFEAFYKAHLGKLLLAEQAARYAAKANYHVARLAYLLRLFPDAKVILPVRSPEGHIASLARQHQWFSTGQRQHPRALAFMQRSGHFEFGLDRRPMNLGESERVRKIVQAWSEADEIRGLALYWDMVYGYVARLLESDAKVRAATLIVRFETMCEAPRETLQAVLHHCGLPEVEQVVEQQAPRIRYPTYYQSNLSPDELAIVRELTADTARAWGY